MPSTATDRLSGISTSVAVKPPCKVAAITNITLSGAQTVNGVAVVEGDRVLVTAQTSGVNNGIWVVNGSAAWARAKDFDGARDAVTGTMVLIGSGAGARLWQVTTTGAIVIGTTSIAFAQIDPSALAVTADQVSLDLAIAYAAGTVGWWDRHAAVSLLRYIPSSKHAAIVAGTNSDDLASYVQLAFNDVLTYGFVLDGHGYSYKINSGVTCQRSSADHSKRIRLRDIELDASALTGSVVALTVGATSATHFLEDGSIELDVTLRGPETVDPRAEAASTTTTGLVLKYAGSVRVNAECFNFYKGARIRFAFPVVGKINARRSWVGVHFDEGANKQKLDLTLTNNRYGWLIMSDVANGAFEDSGKSNTMQLDCWIEGTSVGGVIDTDAGTPGSGAIRHRGIKVYGAYLSQPASMVNPQDFFRVGTRWSPDIPTSTRGADCTEFVDQFVIDCEGGLVNPSGGVFSASNALVAFDVGATRCRNFQLRAICTGIRLDADTLLNAPIAGTAITSGFPGVSDGIIEQVWWNDGAIVRRMLPDGTIMIGAKATAATVTEIGNEFQPDGQRFATATGNGVDDLNRLGSNGTIVSYRREGTIVGGVSVTASATTFATSSDYRLKDGAALADGAAALAAVQSWPIRSFTWRATGAAGVGVLAHELQAVKPEAVTGIKDGAEMQGVDYSKLVPELVAAVQHLAQLVKGQA